ncbi:hypothetical protein ACFLZW_05085 [Chloroflexota bacterium]
MKGKLHNNTRDAFQVLGACVDDQLNQSKPFVSGNPRREQR